MSETETEPTRIHVLGRVLRYEIPVNDQWKVLELNGPIVHVATRVADMVEIWVLDQGPHRIPRTRFFRVFGTGQPIESPRPDVSYRGSAVTPGGAFVWHLFEMGMLDD